MGEATYLTQQIPIQHVVFNCGPVNSLENSLIRVLEDEEISYSSCIHELNLQDSTFSFLQTKEFDNENDNSNVIYTEIDGVKMMFMGDASTETEKEIIHKYQLPNIELLKVGHHGSDTSSSLEFISIIQPNLSIISVGKNNRYGHPKEKVLENLSNSHIYRTDLDGSIKITIKDGDYQIMTYGA